MKQKLLRRKICPFRALILNLGVYCKIAARFVGLIAFFAEPAKLRLCPELPVSPIINARQLAFLEK